MNECAHTPTQEKKKKKTISLLNELKNTQKENNFNSSLFPAYAYNNKSYRLQALAIPEQDSTNIEEQGTSAG